MYSRSVHHGKYDGMSFDTVCTNFAGRFSRNDITPSRTSADWPREEMPRQLDQATAAGDRVDQPGGKGDDAKADQLPNVHGKWKDYLKHFVNILRSYIVNFITETFKFQDFFLIPDLS